MTQVGTIQEIRIGSAPQLVGAAEGLLSLQAAPSSCSDSSRDLILKKQEAKAYSGPRPEHLKKQIVVVLRRIMVTRGTKL